MNCRKTPCEQCPWRRDTPPGQFPAERYEELRATTGTPDEQVGPEAPLFGCHKSHDDQTMPCAGWLRAVGFWNLRVRLMVAMEQIPGEMVGTGDVPTELFGDYEEMVAYQAGPVGAQSFCPNKQCRHYRVLTTVVGGYPCPTCRVGRMEEWHEPVR